MYRSLLALIAVCFCSQQALAYLTAPADKPDPYARRHYTAADLPAAKKLVSMKKGKKQKQTPIADEEIAAEIAREDAGRAPAQAAARAPKEKDCPKAPQTSEVGVRHNLQRPAATHPVIAVCRLNQKPSQIASRYLISDSDGYEACNDRGGEVLAGNEDDRALINVKDAGALKSAKK